MNDKDMQMRRTSRRSGRASLVAPGWRALKKNVPGSLPTGPSLGDARTAAVRMRSRFGEEDLNPRG